ncbi:MAG: 50S ribosomal protein L9 [Gammaproteobacteria bacterium]|jgi:large subunit ribosomal protein L9|nr:50S ribosomal protein L9 [Gammaproteobacteria bacterium]HUV22692.1 50S ribosomal protein L9 [Gammaproteobacteria bacterium]
MDVILMENVENLGAVGDKVSVKSGFARNYLVPQGKAKMATAANLAEFEAIRAELEKAAVQAQQEAHARKLEIEALGVIEVTARVGSEGKLFGSIGVADVSDAIASMGGNVEKSEIRMPEGALRVVGEHLVDIHLYTDIDTQVTVVIIGEE